MDASTVIDRRAQDVGNIIALDHINMCIPDQQVATAFYVVALGFTRDPYKRVGLDNMGINIGRNQLHLPTVGTVRRGETRGAQRVRGTIGLVVPDLADLTKRLEKAAPLLASTQYRYASRADHVEVICPWGNRYRCHAPAPEFGPVDLALAYIEFEVPPGAAAGIARFYHEGLGAPVAVEQQGGDTVARINIGIAQKLYFREADAPLAPYDGHHIQVYLADYSSPYNFLKKRELVIEAGQQWCFKDIVDVDSGRVLYTVEHEVRCLKHPSYNKPLVNRNPLQTNDNRQTNDNFTGRI